MVLILKLFVGALTALWLIGAVYTHYGARELERRYPPAGQFIDVDGLRLHYLDAGTARDELPALVLLHGATTSSLDFAPSLLPPLSQRYRVLAFDRPGHGYSERAADWLDPAEQARLIAAALDRLGVGDSVWVGHSWSGSVVMAALLEQPVARGGVLLAGGTHPWQGGVAWYNDLADTPLLGPLFARSLVYPVGRALLPAGIEAVFAPNAVTPGYREDTAVALTLRPAAALANAADLARLSDFLTEQSRRYVDIRQPLLLVWGEDDTIVPAWNHADRLIKQIPQARLETLADTGHAPHHARRDRVVELIDDFMRQFARP